MSDSAFAFCVGSWWTSEHDIRALRTPHCTNGLAYWYLIGLTGLIIPTSIVTIRVTAGSRQIRRLLTTASRTRNSSTHFISRNAWQNPPLNIYCCEEAWKEDMPEAASQFVATYLPLMCIRDCLHFFNRPQHWMEIWPAIRFSIGYHDGPIFDWHEFKLPEHSA